MSAFIDTDKEREMWVMNDESLYNWFKSEKKPIRVFIKEHKEELNKFIKKKLGDVV